MNNLMEQLPNVKHVTVIGAGYIGLEVVETLRERGLNVRLIHRGSKLMSILDPELSDIIYEEAIKHGVEVLVNEETLGYVGTESVEAVRTKTGTYETDLVVVATGVRPNTQFAQGFAKLENG